MIYRQGDVLIRKIDSLPTIELSEVKSGIILYGEATGHKHRITKGRLFKSKDDSMFLSVSRQGFIVHEEHNPITLDKGYYAIIRQREYHPEEIRNVID